VRRHTQAGRPRREATSSTSATRPNPVAVAFVNTSAAPPATGTCGSHTITGVPDPDNDRLIIYSSSTSSAAVCTGIHIIEVPLDDPASSSR
jgi:hypothetical protein